MRERERGGGEEPKTKVTRKRDACESKPKMALGINSGQENSKAKKNS